MHSMSTNHPIINVIYKGYSESNLRWAVNKTSNKTTKNVLHTKNLHILKLLLNVVTAGIEALVVLGNKFCEPVSKKSDTCELSHVLTPSINSSLLLKCCDYNQFFR
jgi:hypothetical protein